MLELCKVESSRDFQRFSVCEHSKVVEKRGKQSGLPLFSVENPVENVEFFIPSKWGLRKIQGLCKMKYMDINLYLSKWCQVKTS